MTQGKLAPVNSICRVFQPESTQSQFVFPEFALLRAHDKPGRSFNAVLADCDLLPRPNGGSLFRGCLIRAHKRCARGKCNKKGIKAHGQANGKKSPFDYWKNVVSRSLLFVGLVQLNVTRLHVYTTLV
jgi:hypothetical protein